MNIFAVHQDNRGTCCIYFIYIVLVGSCSLIFYICVADLTFYREIIEIKKDNVQQYLITKLLNIHFINVSFILFSNMTFL